MALLHSKIIGEGKPLLILHGFLGMSDNWKTLGNQYAENGFQVHLIDQRNHGRSFHTDEFNYHLLAEDLEYYCQYYTLENICIIGHSMGGKTAMFYAIKNQANVDKLLIADIAPSYYPVHHQVILDGLNTINFNEVSSRKEADLKLSRSIPETGIRQFLLKNLFWKDKDELAFRFNLQALTSNIENIGEALPLNSIYQGKTLFLKGEKSSYIKTENTPLIKQHFPQAEIDEISNAGHWLHAENPKEFFKKSISFLN